MDELEQMRFWADVRYLTAHLLPVLAGAVAIVYVWLRRLDPDRPFFLGAMASCFLGAGGTYFSGADIVALIFGSGDIPHYLEPDHE